MREFIWQKTAKINQLLRDTLKTFALMWQSAPKLTAINVLLYIIQAVLPLLSLFVLKQFVDDLITYKSITWQQSGEIIVLYFLLQVGSVLMVELSSYYTLLHQQIVSNGMARKVLEKSIELDLEYFENHKFYDELYMAQWQSLYRPAELISAMQGFIQSSITILLFSGFLFTVHWSIPLLLVLLSIPLAVSRLLQGYRQFLLNQRNSSLERKAFDLFEYLTSYEYAKEVRIFDFGKLFINQFSSLKKAVYKKGKRLQSQFIKYNISIQFIEIAVIM
ncbi:MAG TPA: ABC transporter transmembrane domain-containing protein, partial [Flavisolibacter sp.]|nr:ABC transporter transmembrane domain-containing protein [Flavisolibacter sp.]